MVDEGSHDVNGLGQAGLPRGWVGRLLGGIMVRHNGPDAKWTIDCLDVSDGERVLEVGFGPGHAIEMLAGIGPAVCVSGIDHSETMLEAAGARNRESVRSGRVDLRLGSVMSLPFGDASFDKACAINCIYFWEPPVEGLRELHRVLSPGGRLAVTVRDRNRKAYQRFKPAELERLLLQAGFATAEIRHNGVSAHPLICAIGTK